MSDYAKLKELAEAANAVAGDVSVEMTLASDPGPNQEEIDAVTAFMDMATPAAVLALIAENEALKGPHDWLAEDLIKELVNNAQAIQENSDDGEEDPFVVVLLAAASRIRRQEANIGKLRSESLHINNSIAIAASADAESLAQQCKALIAERDQLKAENAGLKTGYEAYEQVVQGLKAENEVARMRIKELDLLFGRYILAMRAAVIEENAEKGMEWIYNSLAGPGELPPEDETDAQAYFDREIVAVDDGMQEVMAFHEGRRSAMSKEAQS